MHIEMESLREIGWTRWDPIELLRKGEDWRDKSFSDEYDSYLKRVVKMVLRGDSEGDIVGYLIGITRHRMGMGAGPIQTQAAVSTVRAVTDYINGLRGVKR